MSKRSAYFCTALISQFQQNVAKRVLYLCLLVIVNVCTFCKSVSFVFFVPMNHFDENVGPLASPRRWSRGAAAAARGAAAEARPRYPATFRYEFKFRMTDQRSATAFFAGTSYLFRQTDFELEDRSLLTKNRKSSSGYSWTMFVNLTSVKAKPRMLLGPSPATVLEILHCCQ